MTTSQRFPATASMREGSYLEDMFCKDEQRVLCNEILVMFSEKAIQEGADIKHNTLASTCRQHILPYTHQCS